MQAFHTKKKKRRSNERNIRDRKMNEKFRKIEHWEITYALKEAQVQILSNLTIETGITR